MVTVNHRFPRYQRGKHSHNSSSEEEQNADAQGVTVEVYRLQERLRRVPLVPREDWLRKKRADLVDRLFVAARRDRCLNQCQSLGGARLPRAAPDSGLSEGWPRIAGSL